MILLLIVILSSGSIDAAQQPQRESITVYAAASLKEIVDTLAADWTARSGVDVTVSYAGTAILARQIEQGAPADVVITADQAWMDALAAAGLIKPGGQRVIARNRLVLIAPSGTQCGPFDLRSADAWSLALSGGRLSLAETSSVPAGRYARQALEFLGVWEELQHHLAESDNVRAAMAFVAQGEAPLGLVYATDALAEPRVCVRATFAMDWHADIVYPAAVLSSAQVKPATGFFEFLSSESAQQQFARFGFSAIPP